MHPSYSQISALFLRLGTIGFGGPVALVALMERELCGRLRWVPREEFDRTYVLCKLLPGPVAFQMALAMGHYLRGRLGGVIAGLTFLFPGFVLMLLIAVFYTRISGSRVFLPIVDGLRVGAIVVIAHSVTRMLVPYRREPLAWAIILLAAVAMYALPRWEPLIILLCGLGVVAGNRVRGRLASLLLPLFLTHFKAGALVFGTGLAIIPFLEYEVVRQHGWLTPQAFMDGIAFGQVTPGPITISSVFIGHQVAGIPGALVSLAGMYSPGLLYTLVLLPLIRVWMERRPELVQFQRGAIPAVIGCILGATLGLALVSITDGFSIVLGVVLALAVWKLEMPAWLAIPVGAALSLAWRTFA